jgi:hypothetical protein
LLIRMKSEVQLLPGPLFGLRPAETWPRLVDSADSY